MSTKPSYLDTFPTIDPGRRLVIPVSPMPGEGLPELVMRAASVNGETGPRYELADSTASS